MFGSGCCAAPHPYIRNMRVASRREQFPSARVRCHITIFIYTCNVFAVCCWLPDVAHTHKYSISLHYKRDMYTEVVALLYFCFIYSSHMRVLMQRCHKGNLAKYSRARALCLNELRCFIYRVEQNTFLMVLYLICAHLFLFESIKCGSVIESEYTRKMSPKWRQVCAIKTFIELIFVWLFFKLFIAQVKKIIAFDKTLYSSLVSDYNREDLQ